MVAKEIVQGAVTAETLMRGLVTKLGKRDEAQFMEVVVPMIGSTGLVFLDEADSEVERKTLMPLLGQEIPYVIIGVDEVTGKPLCSRKKAQEILRTQMIQDLVGQKVLHGTVIHAESYGVYIETNGISGILKNGDYIGISFPVKDYLKVGDGIDVICKDITQGGKISWLPAVKPDAKVIEYDIELNTVVIGTVTNLRPFEKGGTGVFVKIDEGLDALCMLPNDMEIIAGDKVAMKIVSIEPSEKEGLPPRVRGRITRIL